jgi:hypothetical protein
MTEATVPTRQEFLSLPDNLAVLDAFVPDNDFFNLLKGINMVLEYETLELPAAVPSVHNNILSEFRSREPGCYPERWPWPLDAPSQPVVPTWTD